MSPSDTIDDTLENPHLQVMAAEAQDNEESVRALFETLEPHQLRWRPAPDVWSVAQCVDHLVAIGKAYYPRIASGIRQAPAQPVESAAEFKPTLLGWLFYQFVRPDRRWKVPTIGMFHPSAAEAGPEVEDRFLRQQRELFALIQSADGRDLSTKFASPAARILRFSVGEGIWLMVEHQKRHLNQARDLLQHPSFPKK